MAGGTILEEQGFQVRAKIAAILVGTLVAAASFATAVVVGSLLVGLFVVAAFLLIPMLVIHPQVRVIVVTFGAFVVFQSPSAEAKVAYFAAVIVCALVAAANIATDGNKELRRKLSPFFVTALAYVFFLVYSLVVSLGNGLAPVDWFRDSLAYWLIVLLPLIGFEAAAQIRARFFLNCIGILSALAGIAISLDWLGRRGIAETDRVLLSSGVIVILGAVSGIVMAARGKNRALWMAVVGISVGGVIVSGTRSGIVTLAAAVVAVFGRQKRGGLPVGRGVRFIVLAAAVIALFVTVAIEIYPDLGAFLTQRVDAVLAIQRGGLAVDASFNARTVAYEIARSRWETSPVVGGGFGFVYPGYDIYTLDTPWVVPAKIGVFGVVVLFAYLVSLVAVLRKMAPMQFVIVRAFAFSLAISTPFGPWVEDKGLAPAICLLVGYCFASTRTSTDAPSVIETSAPSLTATVGQSPSLVRRPQSSLPARS